MLNTTLLGIEQLISIYRYLYFSLQYAKFSIDASEPCDDAGDDGQQLVGHFEIIQVPGYRIWCPLIVLLATQGS